VIVFYFVSVICLQEWTIILKIVCFFYTIQKLLLLLLQFAFIITLSKNLDRNLFPQNGYNWVDNHDKQDEESVILWHVHDTPYFHGPLIRIKHKIHIHYNNNNWCDKEGHICVDRLSEWFWHTECQARKQVLEIRHQEYNWILVTNGVLWLLSFWCWQEEWCVLHIHEHVNLEAELDYWWTYYAK